MTEFAGENFSSVRGSLKRQCVWFDCRVVAGRKYSVVPGFPGVAIEQLNPR